MSFKKALPRHVQPKYHELYNNLWKSLPSDHPTLYLIGCSSTMLNELEMHKGKNLLDKEGYLTDEFLDIVEHIESGTTFELDESYLDKYQSLAIDFSMDLNGYLNIITAKVLDSELEAPELLQHLIQQASTLLNLVLKYIDKYESID